MSKHGARRMEHGSILIASIGALSVFSVLVASLGFQGSQAALLMKRELAGLESKVDFLSGLHLAGQKILTDPSPYEDSLDEMDGFSDEESKLNLNMAPPTFLETFLKLFEKEGHSLKGERKDFVKQVLKAREKGRMLSLYELYFLEDIEQEDIEKLRPYLTVHPDTDQVNINTANPLVLKALIYSLAGDDRAKEELFRKIEEFRNGRGEKIPQVFLLKDLEPTLFLEKLKIRPTLSMTTLISHFLPFVTTDSRNYHLKLTHASGSEAVIADGREAQAVIREKGEGLAIEVLSWNED